MKAARWAMVVDTLRCVGCHSCALICNLENGLREAGSRIRIVSETHGSFPKLSQNVRSERCHQCDDAPCVTVCPTGAGFVTREGVVLVDHEQCILCEGCVVACPYEARYLHPDKFIDKCTLCVHRLEQGMKPACVEVCPAAALTFGNLADPEDEAAKLIATRKATTQSPENGAKPRQYFLE